MAAPLMAFQDPSQSAPGRSHNEGVQEINLNMVPTKVNAGNICEFTSTTSDKFTSLDQQSLRIDNVAAAAADEHEDESYLHALRTCFPRDLFSEKPSSSASYKVIRLCEDFRNRKCTSEEFQHDCYVHILPTCWNAERTGKCFTVSCLYGHDNLSVRKGRTGQARQMIITREVLRMNAETDKQLGYVHLALQPDATTREMLKGRRAARQLQTKLDLVRYEKGGVYEEVRGQAEVLVKAFYELDDEVVELGEGQSLGEEGPLDEDGTIAAMEVLEL